MAAVSKQVKLALFYDAQLDIGAMAGVELGRRERTISKPSNRMGAFDEIRNRSASACHARRVGRFGSDPKRTAAAAGGIAAANINRQRLQTRLRLVRYVLPKYVCAARHCYVAGQSTMQSQLHYVAARLQATVLMVGLAADTSVVSATLLRTRPNTSFDVPRAAAGSTTVILRKCSSTTCHCRTRQDQPQ